MDVLEKTAQSADGDSEGIFEDLEDSEIEPIVMNEILKKTHPEATSARFDILSSKVLGLGELSLFKLKYNISSEGEYMGLFECQGGIAMRDPDNGEYELDIAVRQL